MSELIYLPATTGELRTLRNGALVVPVVALVGDTILHAVNSDAPEFIPRSTLSSNVAAWAGKPVTYGHPVDAHGRHMSANSPGVLAAQAFGTIEHARVSGNKLLMDCHIDAMKAKHVGASRLLARLEAGHTSEISVGCFVATDNTPGTHAGKPYVRRWLSLQPDHLACVERGACSCAQGCGMFQRAASAGDYTPPDPYEAGLAKLRAREAQAAAARTYQPPPLRPTEIPTDGTPPDPYAAGLAAMKENR